MVAAVQLKVSVIASRNLEACFAIHVRQGIVEADEQVQYLEKVAGAQEILIKDEAKIMKNRLKLVDMCDPINAETINAWLTKVSVVLRRRRAKSKTKDVPENTITSPIIHTKSNT